MKTTVAIALSLAAWSASAAPLRFLSFNIYGYGSAEGMPPESRAAGVEESIAKCNADVISLQEVSPAFWSGTPLFAHLAADYGIVRGDEEEALLRAGAPGGYRPPNWVNHEPLLYRKGRLKLLDSGLDFFHLSLQAEKSVTWGVLEDREDGRRFVAFATHFWWQGNGLESDAIRELNARHVLGRVAEIRRKWGDLPVIGGGDLNCRPGSLAHEVFRLAGYRNAADAAQVRSTHRSHHGYPVRGKDGVFRGALRPAADDVPGMSIDHIFFSPGIRALRHHVWTGRPELDVSDHCPVTADFEFTDDPAAGGTRSCASVPGSPSTLFVEAARAAYATPGFEAYTNTIVHLFAGHAADTLDRPRQGDIVRWILVPGARNVRDIGGWTGLREGRVYRGTELNAVGDHKLKIGSAGRKIMVDELGIKTDLDFRAVDEKSRGACVTNSALGAGVRLVDAPILAYTGMFGQTNEYAAVLRVFADEKNYPVYMHCWGGADRTGTVAFILEGLCGVPEADLAIDYELTSFSMFNLRTRMNRGKFRYAEVVARIKEYPGATLQAKLEAYAKRTLGLTDEEMAAIRRNLCK
ncbi:MAG: tyrosine-protein phosphatase [Kiritimatiellae bacterium]|nr:tyrosine-protein phosphatase [Kiritimatiellia bacterium]